MWYDPVQGWHGNNLDMKSFSTTTINSQMNLTKFDCKLRPMELFKSSRNEDIYCLSYVNQSQRFWNFITKYLLTFDTTTVCLLFKVSLSRCATTTSGVCLASFLDLKENSDINTDKKLSYLGLETIHNRYNLTIKEIHNLSCPTHTYTLPKK